MSFANSVVWITGASSGIGEAIAVALASYKNISLVISARRADELQRVANQTNFKPVDTVNGYDRYR